MAIARASKALVFSQDRKEAMEVWKQLRKNLGPLCDAYHALNSDAKRDEVAQQLMEGTLRVVSATSALGMVTSTLFQRKEISPPPI
jgi:superfamily II DNA helicase RecQ